MSIIVDDFYLIINYLYIIVMGLNVSKIKYLDIHNVTDIIKPQKNKNKKIYTHIITYTNGNKQTITLSEKQEKIFKENCETYNQLKPLINLKYSMIENIVNKTITIKNDKKLDKFDIIYNDDTMKRMELSEYQSDVFWKIYSEIKKNNS